MKFIYRFAIIGGLLALVSSSIQAQFASFQLASNLNLGITPLKIGAGGFINALDIASDGTMVGRSDTYGAYVWNPNVPNPGNAGGTGAWQQVVSSTSMPSLLSPGSVPLVTSDYSCYDIRIAPSNSSIFYMAFQNLVWISSNKGVSWTQTNFSTVTMAGNVQANENVGPYIAIDPANSNVVYVGTPSGTFRSLDGGNTWSTVTGVGTAGSVGSLVAMDSSGGTTTLSGVTVTANVYVGTQGTGVYKSTNGGSSFSLTSSGPTAMGHMTVTPAGAVYVTDATSNTNTFHKLSAAGTWSTITTGTALGHVAAIAIDPANSNNIVATNGFGENSMTTTGDGGPWSTAATNANISAADIPWLQNGVANAELSSTDLKFDPSQSNVVYLAQGTGVLKMSPNTSSSAPTWTSQSAGIENMVGNWAISPPGGYLLVLFLDRSIFTVTDITKYPTQYGTSYATFGGGIKDGWGADWAANTPATIAAISQAVDANQDYSGIATNNNIGSGTTGAPSNWTAFSGISQITDLTVNGGTKFGGSMAAASPTNIVWAMSNDNSGGNTHVWVTTDGGANWSVPASLPVGGWGNAPFSDNRQIVIADRVNIGTFYAYNSGASAGIWSSTNNGSTWTNVSSGTFDGANSTISAVMRSVPNIGTVSTAGHSYYTSGHLDGQTLPFYRTTNGWATRTTVPNVTAVSSFGFGPPRAGGGGYPSMYIYGIVSGTAVASGVSGQLGIWRSDDGQNTNQTWTQLSNTFPGGSYDKVRVVEGDANTYGVFYIGFAGSSFMRGVSN